VRNIIRIILGRMTNIYRNIIHRAILSDVCAVHTQ
jgi:hypothetical protein